MFVTYTGIFETFFKKIEAYILWKLLLFVLFDAFFTQKMRRREKSHIKIFILLLNIFHLQFILSRYLENWMRCTYLKMGAFVGWSKLWPPLATPLEVEKKKKPASMHFSYMCIIGAKAKKIGENFPRGGGYKFIWNDLYVTLFKQ